jgi:flavodoxin
MKAAVVYDSVHGNTEQVARTVADAVGRALGSAEEVEARRVTEVDPERLGDLDILIVGAPTHALQPSPAAKTFLKSIPSGGLKGVRVAGFDTRLDVEETGPGILIFVTRIFGYAAKPIANRLERKGGELALPPEGFIVEDTEGPLREGELERAAEWARPIGEASS